MSERFGKAEINDDEFHIAVDEAVCCFQIPMDHTVRVDVVQAGQEHKHDALYFVWSEEALLDF